MEISKILDADLLDIIFDGRNKDYGAYELRRSYNNRMLKASMITVAMLSLLITGYIFANKFSGGASTDKIVGDVVLIEVPETPSKQEPVMPPKVKTAPPAIETVKSLVPLIVKDELAPDDQRPPDNEQLDEARIGDINVHGVTDDGREPTLTVEDKGGVVSVPKKEVDERDTTFSKVEIESNYPGGTVAWMRYLNKTFKYPAEAQEIGLQGTVTVQFIVDTDGNVSNVEAISGPESGGLRVEAVRVIRRSGKWEPAIQNGRHVKSYKKQPITFRLESE